MKRIFLFLVAACMVLAGCSGEKEVTETPVTATMTPTEELTATPEPTEAPEPTVTSEPTAAPTEEPTATPEPTETPESTEAPVEESAAGVAEFRGITWERDAEHDIEYLRFLTNGQLRYSCGCGNPVNDSDACESYDYDPETGMITLNCFDEIEGMVTEIKMISCDGNTLVLNFSGDVRTFTKE